MQVLFCNLPNISAISIHVLSSASSPSSSPSFVASSLKNFFSFSPSVATSPFIPQSQHIFSSIFNNEIHPATVTSRYYRDHRHGTPPRTTAMATQQSAATDTTTAGSKSEILDHSDRHLQPIQVKTSSPRFPPSPSTTSPAQRRIAIAVDLSDESAYAVKWAVENYLRPGDGVILLHVRSTSVLYGADWGSSTPTANPVSEQEMEEEYDNFTATKSNHLAKPLVDAHVSFKIHIVKDHDMKERLCLEVERLGLSAVIMGSRGIGASRSSSKGKLGSVSDYCVQHCVCPVVVVRYNQDDQEKAAEEAEAEAEAEEELQEFHDANDYDQNK